MNKQEIILFIVSFLLLFFIGYRITKNPVKQMLLSFILLPALYIAIESATQFLTCDETYIILELEDPTITNYQAWGQSAFRTSLILTSPLLKLVKAVFGNDLSINAVHSLAKAVHWMSGFLLILLLYYLIQKYILDNKYKLLYFIIFFLCTLLLPTNILALKIVNYDLLAMLFASIAVVLSVISFKEGKIKFAILSVISASLAAQEKLIASPFLLTTIVSFPVFMANYQSFETKTKNNKNFKKDSNSNQAVSHRNNGSGLWIFINSSLAIVIAFIVCCFTFFVAGLIHKKTPPATGFGDIITPLLSFLFPTHKMIIRNSFTGHNYPPFAIVIYILIVFIISFATIKIIRRNKIGISISRNLGIFKYFPYLHSPLLILYILVFVILTGILFTYLVKPYYHPYYNLAPGAYLPSISMNDAALHFNVQNHSLHLLSYIAFSYATFANGFTTVFLLLVMGLLLYNYSLRGTAKYSSIPVLLNVYILIILAFPALYALTNTPVSTRYLNLFLYLITTYLGIIFCQCLGNLNNRKQTAFVFVFTLLFILEIIPFTPVIGSFRPWWNKPDKEFSALPLAGEMRVGIWPGWGEENYLAGEKIKELAGKTANATRIFCSYPGEWLTDDKSVNFVRFNEMKRGISENDYYIIGRDAVAFNRYPFLFKEKPVFTIDYMGVTMAWVFRGDQMKDRLFFISPVKNGGWLAEIPEYEKVANSAAMPNRSKLLLFEDDKPLGPASAPFDEIRKKGKGRYNHWEKIIFFSTSDNSDPRTNKRVYRIKPDSTSIK